MMHQLLTVLYVVGLGALTLFSHDRWGLPGALGVVALSIGLHGLMLRRQRANEDRVRSLLERLSDHEIRTQLAAMPEEDRGEVLRVLQEMGRGASVQATRKS